MPWFGHHSYLTDHIRKHRSRRLLEIGVYDGDNAVDMIVAASEASGPDHVEYYGFDYFEEYSEEEVAHKLSATRCNFHLYKGDTVETLPKISGLPLMDLIFIDGGKSQGEANNDWRYSSRLMHEASVVFIHNADFNGVRRMVKGISRSKYEVMIFSESPWGLVARVELRKNST